MSAENVALVRGVYESFGRGDIPAVVAALDPDIEWVEPYPVGYNPGTHDGPDTVQWLIAQTPADLPSPALSV